MLLFMTKDHCEVKSLTTVHVTQSELSLFPNLSKRQDSQSAENTGFRVRWIHCQVLVLPTYQPRNPAKLFKLPVIHKIKVIIVSISHGCWED